MGGKSIDLIKIDRCKKNEKFLIYFKGENKAYQLTIIDSQKRQVRIFGYEYYKVSDIQVGKKILLGVRSKELTLPVTKIEKIGD